MLASWTVPDDIHRSPTCVVPTRIFATGVAGTPGRQQSQCVAKLSSWLGELILQTGRTSRVRPRHQESDLLEVLESAGKDVRRYPGDVDRQLTEPTRAIEQCSHDEQRPSIADSFGGMCKRRR